MANPSWTVRALSVQGDDTELALWVSFDNARFCFGAGEGIQRTFIQKRLSMRGLQGIFLPNGQNSRFGLPGMILTAADQGMNDVTVVGPPDTTSFLASIRGSVMRDAFQVISKPYPRDSTAPVELMYESARMTVYGVALRPEDNWVSLENSELPRRPTTLSPEALEAFTGAIVQEQFGRKYGRTSDLARYGLDPPDIFPGMDRYVLPDDRYPIPLPSDADVATDMVYICRTPDVRGKFDVAKAKELNVPNGPVRGKLTRGETIVFDDPTAPGGRRTVTPEDCLVGGGPGSILIVVNCREHNLDRLLASTAFQAYHQKDDGGAPEFWVHAVVHNVPLSVWEDERYQAWVATFGKATEHHLVNQVPTHEAAFSASAWNAYRLSLIDPKIFRVPYYVTDATPAPTLPANASVLQVNHLLKMHPPKSSEVLPNHDRDVAFPTTVEGLAAQHKDTLGLSRDYALAIKRSRDEVAAIEAQRAMEPTQPGDDIVVTTLGTGSAIPSKYRNVSATHLDIPDMGGVLLDCGEGTLGQMRRCWGPEGVKKVLSDLRVINVSHMHADHHLGLCSILKERFDLGLTSPLYLIAPWAIVMQLQETATWQAGASREALENVMWLNIQRLRHGCSPEQVSREYKSDVVYTPEDAKNDRDAFLELSTAEDVAAGKRKWPFANVSRFSTSAERHYYASVASFLQELGLTYVRTPMVTHRGIAYGLVLQHKSGWKIAYSGDTKPCAAFVEAAKNATIVIHEATIEDDKPDVAEAKGHSTFGQAINVGIQAGAKYVVLNHFSQRYPKAPNVELSHSTVGTREPVVTVSFDFMSLRAGDAWKMAHYMEPINILFREVEGEEDDTVEANGSIDQKPKGKHEQKAGAKGGFQHAQTALAGRPGKEQRKQFKAERREQAMMSTRTPRAPFGTKRDSPASDSEHQSKKLKAPGEK